MTALLADVGGTNARFALFDGTAAGDVLHLPVADYATFYEAAAAALERLGCAEVPQNAVLDFAGPVGGGRAVMTNAGWDTTTGELTRRFGFVQLRLLNDYSALSLGLAHLSETDKLRIGPSCPELRATRAVLGPGSGLGVGAAVPGEPYDTPLISEGGHATMSAADDLDEQILALLRPGLGHVSAERVLSGPGLENLHRALAELHGRSVDPLPAAEVTRLALAGGDDLCRQALERFCLFLGSFAGNMALTFGAQGGVYLAGGILPRFPDFLAASGFRARFEDKGRFRKYLSPIPTWLITRRDAAFVGLAAVARGLA